MSEINKCPKCNEPLIEGPRYRVAEDGRNYEARRTVTCEACNYKESVPYPEEKKGKDKA